MKEWTLFLRKGVPFHFGYGEFTARDVVHSHALMLREEAVATFVGMWRNVEEVKVINAYQVVFCMKGPATTLLYALSRRGDLRMVSKAQWDEVPWNDRRVRQAMNMAINRQCSKCAILRTVLSEGSRMSPPILWLCSHTQPRREEPHATASECTAWFKPNQATATKVSYASMRIAAYAPRSCHLSESEPR
jgi:ABC-type transport system substrate-binding protein